MIKKFRAWDEYTQKYIVTGFHIFGEVMLFNMIDQYLDENPNPAYDGCSILRTNDVVIEQFLGQDKLKNDIYEGDICLERHLLKKDDAHWVASLEYFPKHWFDITGSRYENNYESTVDMDDCEVVGNIHENKDLV